MKLTISKQVGDDGRLVPATDDELVEVEHLLEDDGTQLQLAEVQGQSEQCPSSEWLLPNTSHLEGMGGHISHSFTSLIGSHIRLLRFYCANSKEV